MKERIPVLILAGLVVALSTQFWQRERTQAAPSEAGVDKKERTLNVSGSAKVRFSPDSARIFFAVDTTAPTVKAARTEANNKMSRVMDAINALKVAGLKMKTSDIHVNAVHERRKEGDVEKTVHVGYHVNISFTVLVQDSDAEKLSATASRILDTGLESGANVVQTISFFKEKWHDHQREAMTKAVEDALANARAMAEGAKVSLVATTVINGIDHSDWGGGPPMRNVQTANVRFEGSTTPIVAGDLEISYRVQIVCTY